MHVAWIGRRAVRQADVVLWALESAKAPPTPGRRQGNRMDLSLQRGQSRGSAWTRWARGVLCALLAWPAVQAYAARSDASMIHGPSLAVGYGQNCAIDTAGQLKCWGNTSYDLDRPPAGHYVSVASGAFVSCALRSDGEAVCWGSSAGGATTPPPGPWRSLAVGSEEACGLRPDGALQCWGTGQNGVGALAPIGERFIAVSIAFMDGCAIRTDGTLQCWGNAGPDGIALSAVPQGHFTSVSVKNEHACALRSDGRIACWGNNYYGQNDAPTDAGFIAVSAGSHFGCALREDGSAVCWGYLYDGALNAPPGRFTQISAGSAHACATRLDGTAQCWGWDYGWDDWLHERGTTLTGLAVGGGEACALDADGEAHCAERVPSMQPPTGRYSQLDLGAASGCGILRGGATTCWGASLGPTPAAAMSTVSVGEAHACGLLTDGAAVCWGDNTFGQTEAPPGRYASVVTGDRYSCAITVAGTVECWGQDALVSGVPVGSGFRSLVGGNNTICAEREPDFVSVCWGDGGNWLGQFTQLGYRIMALGDYFACAQFCNGDVVCDGDRSRAIPNLPADSVDIAAAGGLACAIGTSNQLQCSGGEAFERQFNTLHVGTGSVATGRAHTCSASGSGVVDCWGDNAQRQRVAPPIRASAVIANGDQSCAILGDSSLQCWGDVHRGGGLPLPGTAVRDVDVGQYNGCAVRTDAGAACWGWNVNGQSSPPANTFRRVATGLNHSCGIRKDSTLACWGYGADGQTAAPAGEFIALDVGERHSCAIAVHGLLHCWGMDGEGQATPPPGATYRALSAGAFHNCAIRSDGVLVCWGRNDKGQATPPQGRFASVSAGVTHSCAVRDSGGRVCWGDNGSGQSPSLAIGTDALPRGERNQPYEARLVATGSASDIPRGITFRVVSGALPSGIELDADGLLLGWPQADGASDIVVEARDLNGFSAQRAYRIQIGVPKDTAPPLLELVVTGSLGDDGWYVGDVDIRWLSEGQQSGIDYTSGCENFVLSQDTRYRLLQCTVGTRGGTGSAVSRTLKRDATPPRIREWLNPEAPNAEGWFNTPVTVFYDCHDVTSGVTGGCPQSAALSTEGVHVFPIQSVRDRAGNIGNTPRTPIRIDMTRPLITATMPPAQLPIGATHDFQLSATDALSGVLSLGCTPIDTATVGMRQAVCQAIDRAGNDAVLSAQYEVVVAKQRGRLRPASPVQRRDVPPKAKAARLR